MNLHRARFITLLTQEVLARMAGALSFVPLKTTKLPTTYLATPQALRLQTGINYKIINIYNIFGPI